VAVVAKTKQFTLGARRERASFPTNTAGIWQNTEIYERGFVCSRNSEWVSALQWLER